MQRPLIWLAAACKHLINITGRNVLYWGGLRRPQKVLGVDCERSVGAGACVEIPTPRSHRWYTTTAGLSSDKYDILFPHVLAGGRFRSGPSQQRAQKRDDEVRRLGQNRRGPIILHHLNCAARSHRPATRPNSCPRICERNLFRSHSNRARTWFSRLLSPFFPELPSIRSWQNDGGAGIVFQTARRTQGRFYVSRKHNFRALYSSTIRAVCR